MTFRSHMPLALAQAQAAALRGEVPVGAVLLDAQGRIVAVDGNRTREFCDPTAHAEILVIREGCRQLRSERLPGYQLYVTLEPCPMCAAAIAAARIARVYFGASDPKSGGVLHGPRIFAHPQAHHRPDIYDGLAEEEAAQMLTRFFAERRG